MNGFVTNEVSAIDRWGRDKYYRNEKSHALELSNE
jgi:hypothetical protein